MSKLILSPFVIPDINFVHIKISPHSSYAMPWKELHPVCVRESVCLQYALGKQAPGEVQGLRDGYYIQVSTTLSMSEPIVVSNFRIKPGYFLKNTKILEIFQILGPIKGLSAMQCTNHTAPVVN